MQRKYKARAKAWGLGETESGREQVAIEFEILTQDAEANFLTWHGYFTDKTVQRTIESLRICGWTGYDLADLGGLDANEVELVVDDEEYKGQMVAKIRWVNRLGGGGLALKSPIGGEKLKAFSASMRDTIKAFDAENGTRPAAAKRPAPVRASAPASDSAPPLVDDDLLF